MKILSNTELISLGLILALVAAVAIAGCGSGGSGGADSGTLTLRVTDAPVDMANRVVVIFNGVEIQPAEGQRLSFPFAEPKEIDLLAQSGGASEVILNSVSLPAGAYNWIRLDVNAEKGVLDSFIEFTDLSVESLWVPPGNETGLHLNNRFTVPAGGSADFALDFDLRKSVHDPKGFADFILRPTIRMVDNVRVGKIAGIVNATLLDTSAYATNAVYVYSGDVTPDDVGGNPEPVNTGIVDKTTGEYVVGFLLEGQYTVAFTNQADLDSSDTDDAIDLILPALVSVTAGKTSRHDFNP